MPTGGWKTPWPIRFGGTAHEPVEDAYLSLRANIGDALSDEEDSATDAETQAQARLIAGADARLQSFVEQSDPRALSSMLARWEAILGIQPSRNDSDATRRQRVSARLLTNYTASTEGIDRIARESFYPWKAKVHYTDADQATKYWPGGTSHPTYDWYSTVARIVVEYYKPAYASKAAVDKRVAACTKALDEFAPAWTIFEMSQTQTTGTNANLLGFYLDQPNLDVSVLWP